MLSYKYTTKTWFTNEILAGPVVTVVNNDKVTFSIKIAGGIQQVQSPKTQENDTGYTWEGVSYISYTGHYSEKNYQPRMISYNFVFDAGADLKIKLNNKFGININMDYLASRASFNGNTSYISDYWDVINQTHTHSEKTNPISFTKTISLFCFDVGVSYKLR